MLFDEHERSFMGSAYYAESEYAYLNRSGRPAAGRVRSLMNKWYMEYPECSRADIRGRFQSNDPGQHVGALNELLLFALFRRLGYEVDVAPPGPSNISKPDFALASEVLPDFDLEATVSELPASERSRIRRANVLYDTINRIKTEDFMLMLGSWSGPDTNPPSRVLRNKLQQWLDGLDVDKVASTSTRRMDDFPTYHFNHEGWAVKVWAILQKEEFRGVPVDSPIGGFLSGIHPLDTPDQIRRALEDKTTKYGLRDRPYVIAVAFGKENPFVRVCNLEAALFGSDKWLVHRDQGVIGRGRESDGIFWGPKGPRNTRVSGVILIRRLDAWGFANQEPIFMENPWAKHPLLELPRCFDRWFGSKDDPASIHRGSESSLSQVFDLPDGWPIGKDDDELFL